MTATVKCPTCQSKVVWSSESAFRPFCSDRCKQIDLGAWASDEFKVEGANPSSQSDIEAIEQAFEEMMLEQSKKSS